MNSKLTHTYENFGRNSEIEKSKRTIYWGEVISLNDTSDGGIIKVRVNGFDSKLKNEELPDAYPLLPKFFHIYPKVGEVVRIFIEDINYPQRSRYWMGSVISQPHKINYDGVNTALSTTNIGVSQPDESPDVYPDAEGIYPTKEDVALIGRLNNDIVLRDNEIELRVGKHEANNNLIINRKNVGSVRLVFESTEENEFRSSTVVQSDKIALLSTNGYPKFKSFNLSKEDRDKVFEKSSPIPRGDVLVSILKLMLAAIKGHVHPYDKLSPDVNDVIKELEKINFKSLLNDDIVTN